MLLSEQEARQILAAVRQDVAGDGMSERLYQGWIRDALRYAEVRAAWAVATPEERREMDAQRTRLHDGFIAATNALSRSCARRGGDATWRRMLGDDRKRIGDLACHLHCFIGLEAR